MLFCFLFRFLIVFAIISIEEKLVKEIRNIEMMFLVCGESVEVIFCRFIIVMNLLEISLVVMILFICSVLLEGIFIIYVIG